MAFPQVATTSSSVEAANTSTHDLLIPTGTSSGDLLIAFLAMDGDETVTLSGWTRAITQSANQPVQCQGEVWYKTAGASESDTTWSTGTNEQSVTTVFRITGWHGSSAPEATGDGGDTSGGSATPDPPSITATWGSEDNLFIAFYAGDGDPTASAYPTNYDDNQSTTNSKIGGGSCNMGIATRELASATDDPGTFTKGGSDDWAAITVVVRPSAGGTVVPQIANHYRRRRA